MNDDVPENPSTPLLPELRPDIGELLDDPRPGQVPRILGYELKSLLGKGNSPVYRAVGSMNPDPVALKVIPLGKKPLDLIRVHREAAALRELRHPNVVRFLQVWERKEKAVFLAMELLPGPTLEEYFLGKGRLSPVAVAKIGLQASQGLEALHEKGFVHRDLKMRNMMFDGSGHIKIVDLGLVKSLKAPTEDTASVLGNPIGSWETMPPEQYVGLSQYCSDLFSLGCVLYHLAVGSAPFPDSFHNVPGRPRPQSPHDRDSKIPSEFSQLIMGLLEPFPEDRRPATAQELSRKLEDFLAGKLSMHPSASTSTVMAEEDPSQLIELAKTSMNLQTPRLDHYHLLMGLFRRVQLCCDLQDALELLLQKIRVLEREIGREPHDPAALIRAIEVAFVEYTAGIRAIANQASLWPALNRLVQETNWQLQFFRQLSGEVPKVEEVRSVVKHLDRLVLQVKDLYQQALTALERSPRPRE